MKKSVSLLLVLPAIAGIDSQSEIFGALDVDLHFDDYRSVEGSALSSFARIQGLRGTDFCKADIGKDRAESSPGRRNL